jgi:hypothetical protein
MVALFLNCSVGDELKFCLATRGQLLNDLLFLLGVEHALAALQRTVIFAAGSLVVTRMQGSGPMFRIPRKYSHFIFGVIQAGLTSLVAAGIASFPSPSAMEFCWPLALVLAGCLDRDVACRGVGRSGNQSNLHCGHARMSRATSRIGAKTNIRSAIDQLRFASESRHARCNKDVR